MAEPNAFSSGAMQHFILTPFYVRRHFNTGSGQIEVRLAPPEWLAGRLRLFEAYCLPSVIAQSDQDFRWFLYFDDATPAEYLDRVASLTLRHRNIHIKRCALWEGATLERDLLAALDAGKRWVMTTRLDNDDGIRRDFVSMLHAAARERTEFLNFPRGIIWYSGKCYRYTHQSNAFLSMVEPANAPRTVWVAPHEEASGTAPVRQLAGTPAFLQVVHGQNVSNKPRGMRMSARRALEGFEGIEALRGSAATTESLAGILLENATRGVAWRARDALIALAKPIRRFSRRSGASCTAR
jgi:hypothetical protein